MTTATVAEGAPAGCPRRGRLAYAARPGLGDHMSDVLKQFDLSGRLALLTGSSAGIGLALARGLAGAGAAVVLNGRRADKRKSETSSITAAQFGNFAERIPAMIPTLVFTWLLRSKVSGLWSFM